MKITIRKDKLDTRYCIRCSILESDVKRDGSYGCSHGWGSRSYKKHSYITDRKLKEWSKDVGLAALLKGLVGKEDK